METISFEHNTKQKTCEQYKRIELEQAEFYELMLVPRYDEFLICMRNMSKTSFSCVDYYSIKYKLKQIAF